MLESASNYALSIVCASFLINIIQMILPSGENKKYVLFVSTMIIMIILINPIISFLNKDFDLMEVFKENEESFNLAEEESYNNYYEEQVFNMYKKNLEADIVKRLEENGYEVNKIECEYDDISKEPNYLRLELKQNDGSVTPVRIEVSGNNTPNREMSAFEVMKIKSFIKEMYGIDRVDIN